MNDDLKILETPYKVPQLLFYWTSLQVLPKDPIKLEQSIPRIIPFSNRAVVYAIIHLSNNNNV